jgi:hypothetical protein
METLHIDTVNPHHHASARWAFSAKNPSLESKKQTEEYQKFMAKVSELEGATPSEEEQITFCLMLRNPKKFGYYWKGKLIHQYELLTP